MTIELFIATVFKASIAIAFLALCMAAVTVSLYYSWKMAEDLIRKRVSYLGKIKKSKVFKTFNEPKHVLKVVKSNGKKLQAKG